MSLKASRLPGARRIALAARLVVAEQPAAARGRTVVLESYDGAYWARAARAVTDSTGRAVWRTTFAPGSYRVRVRYPGTAEIGAATSAPLTLRIR
jgi:hypothetical protein